MININVNIGEPQPLILRPGTNESWTPSSSAGNIVVDQNENVKLYCTKSFNAPFKGNTIIATCVGGILFFAEGIEVSFTNFTCTELPVHSTRRSDQKCIGGKITNIGFKFGVERWLNLMNVCHDEQNGLTHWVHYHQNPENRGFQRQYPRIGFIQSDFYAGLPVNLLYTRNRQRETISKTLGSAQLGQSLIAQEGDLFMSRGHLAARSDFIFGVHQHATFYFINAAPQWQTFNGGNWEVLENYLKRYVDRKDIRVDIYTGTYGVLTFNDIHGKPREIFLANNGTDRRIPVPKLYYKLVIDKRNSAGIVFLGVNNPYITMNVIQREYVYCENVMDQVKYIPWDKESLEKGYLYACRVSDFLKFYKHLPQLDAIDKLLL